MSSQQKIQQLVILIVDVITYNIYTTVVVIIDVIAYDIYTTVVVIIDVIAYNIYTAYTNDRVGLYSSSDH